MISLHKIGLDIDNQSIFKDLSLTILPHAIVKLNGKNGSGKTSLLRMIAGIQKPSNGKMKHGLKNYSLDTLALPYCTYIGHKLGLKQELSALDNIKLFAKITNSEMLVPAAIKYFKLEENLDKKCFELSAGNQKKLVLTRLLLNQSKLWLLDELDSNLDSDNKKILDDLIKTHVENGGIVIYTSHSTNDNQNIIHINIEDYKCSN